MRRRRRANTDMQAMNPPPSARLIINQRLVTAILLAVLAFGSVVLTSVSTAAQRRKRPTTRLLAASKTIDYSKFLHGKEHLKDRKGADVACATCHKIPTANAKQVRGFPDVADYPDHDACVSCHRKQFFVGARPLICTNCHGEISPTKGARFDFPRPQRSTEFKIDFPHGKHQDVIAFLNGRPALLANRRSNRVSRVEFAHVAEDRKPDYNNCTVCHSPNTTRPAPAVDKWIPGFFKTIPDRHSKCFSCHWTGTAPTSEQCGACHKVSAPVLYERQSTKFNHEGGVPPDHKGAVEDKDKSHPAECTKCHINITKSSILRGRTPDVPITSCASCHNQKPTPGAEPTKCSEPEKLRGSHPILDELACLKADQTFSCTYCHDRKTGLDQPPGSHFLVTGVDQFVRKDLK